MSDKSLCHTLGVALCLPSLHREAYIPWCIVRRLTSKAHESTQTMVLERKEKYIAWCVHRPLCLLEKQLATFRRCQSTRTMRGSKEDTTTRIDRRDFFQDSLHIVILPFRERSWATTLTVQFSISSGGHLLTDSYWGREQDTRNAFSGELMCWESPLHRCSKTASHKLQTQNAKFWGLQVVCGAYYFSKIGHFQISKTPNLSNLVSLFNFLVSLFNLKTPTVRVAMLVLSSSFCVGLYLSKWESRVRVIVACCSFETITMSGTLTTELTKVTGSEKKPRTRPPLST